jgi:hypothetical protein
MMIIVTDTQNTNTLWGCRIYLQSASQICRTLASQQRILCIDYVLYLCVLYDFRNEQGLFSPKPQCHWLVFVNEIQHVFSDISPEYLSTSIKQVFYITIL